MDESKELVRVFVYGTLKPGESNYQSYCAQLVAAQRAIAFGQLFALPLGYPAMTLGNCPIYGFLLSFPSDTVLQQLDWLEDYDPYRVATENEYNRLLIETYNLELESLGLAWVYLMTPERVRSCGGIFLSAGWWSASVQSIEY